MPIDGIWSKIPLLPPPPFQLLAGAGMTTWNKGPLVMMLFDPNTTEPFNHGTDNCLAPRFHTPSIYAV